MENWKKLIFSKEGSFEEKVHKVFKYQFEQNLVYHRYCEALGIHSPDTIEQSEEWESFPLLSIRAFKDAELTCQPDHSPDLIFKSSGTSGMERSQHLVADSDLYRQSLLRGFRHFYNPGNAVILAYTPGYSDNPDSSLVWMLRELIKQDESSMSRFLPLNKPLNQKEIDHINNSGKQLILFGAAFGLIDLVEISKVKLPYSSIVIETGGMKTHKREMGRMKMHRKLAEGFGLELNHIHSEYGMAELLSQAYATGGKWFRTVPWMQVSIRNVDDPQEILPAFQEGLIGVIDLANVHSCSFLLTGDKGIMDRDGRFQVLGRWNPKDLRGCNFLIEED